MVASRRSTPHRASTTPKAGTKTDASIYIRPAQSDDGLDILRLIQALADFEKLPPPDDAAQQRLLSDAFGPKPRFEIFLAEVEGQIAGYAFIFETYSTFLALPTLYLEDLFVLEEYRGTRVGYTLFRYCAEQALSRGCGRLDWVVLDWNRQAINFYEQLGAKHLDDWLSYRLDREGIEKLAGE